MGVFAREHKFPMSPHPKTFSAPTDKQAHAANRRGWLWGGILLALLTPGCVSLSYTTPNGGPVTVSPWRGAADKGAIELPLPTKAGWAK